MLFTSHLRIGEDNFGQEKGLSEEGVFDDLLPGIVMLKMQSSKELAAIGEAGIRCVLKKMRLTSDPDDSY